MTTTDLTPPDLTRCQAEITTHRPFVLGGPTRVIERCKNEPRFIAREVKAGADGLIGSMSLCPSCAEVARKTLGENVTLDPIRLKFAGHRSYDQIRAECKAQGLILEDKGYREHGSDWIGIRGNPDGTLVLYSTPTGRFYGHHPATGKVFTESSQFDGEPWFDALLSFFYYTKPNCNG